MDEIWQKYSAADTMRRDAEDALKKAEAIMKELEPRLLDQMAESGLDKITIKGITYSPNRRLYVGPVDGADKETVAKALIESGLEVYVQQGYNSNSLSAYVRNVADEHGGRDTMSCDELRQKFLSIAYQAGRDVVELPPATHTVVPIEIGQKAMRTYKSLSSDLYAQVGSGEVTAANAMVKLLRLQQLTGGYLKLDDGSVQHIDSEKMDALADLLEGMGDEPAIVFCRFRTDTKWWHEYAVKGDVHFIKGRLKFGDATAGAPFPSALVLFWPKP